MCSYIIGLGGVCFALTANWQCGAVQRRDFFCLTIFSSYTYSHDSNLIFSSMSSDNTAWLLQRKLNTFNRQVTITQIFLHILIDSVTLLLLLRLLTLLCKKNFFVHFNAVIFMSLARAWNSILFKCTCPKSPSHVLFGSVRVSSLL